MDNGKLTMDNEGRCAALLQNEPPRGASALPLLSQGGELENEKWKMENALASTG
jgi:hypothetical protein